MNPSTHHQRLANQIAINAALQEFAEAMEQRTLRNRLTAINQRLADLRAERERLTGGAS